MDIEQEALPFFLQSFENLTAHFDQHFGPLDNNQTGDIFLAFARKLVPLTDEGQEFEYPEVSPKKSHDKGVDLFTAINRNNEILCIQSKYKITEKIHLDTIISKFKNYETHKLGIPDSPLFSYTPDDESTPTIKYMIVTSSKLENIIKLYNKASMGAKDYYDALVKQKRLIVVDGPRILGILQRLFRKAFHQPTNVAITASHGWLKIGPVRLGTIRGSDLLRLHEEHGDALFFENIRDFLGVTSGKKQVRDRENVNGEIIKTIENEPSKMLERNNGITIKAKSIEDIDVNTSILDNAAIVNGCQTTMCLVHCNEQGKDCLIQVKIVITPEGWDIAKSANYQNKVDRIELDLARYLRHQNIKKVAAELHYAYDDGVPDADKTATTASGVIDSIYQNRIAYNEIQSLFLGLFSNRPNNMFENNYTDIRTDLLAGLYRSPEREKEIFGCLFKILTETRIAIRKCEEVFDDPEFSRAFKRFHDEDKPRYRAFLAVLTLCGTHHEDISDRSSKSEIEILRTQNFLQKTDELLDKNPDLFRRNFLLAYKVLANYAITSTTTGEDSEISRNMVSKIAAAKFAIHYRTLLMDIQFANKGS